MNSSAKMTAISFLAAAALGAAVFSGCTTGSSTVDDTDGGTQSNNKDSGTSSGDSGNSSTDDSGAKCESKQDGDFISPECQSCLAGACCTELKGCFNLAADADGGKVDCNDYSTCIDDCANKATEPEQTKCYDDCDLTAADGVKEAYSKIEECGNANCKAPCGGE